MFADHHVRRLAAFHRLELQPDPVDTARHAERVANLHKEVRQKNMPTDADYQRHPSMHRTNTLDYIACVKGQVWLMTDIDEVLMTPGDVVVIRGTNHGWSNRGTEPCLLIGVMIDAVP
ncbi:MAG: hypothetical protein JWM77_211 [Rhodospirillales bacterium]|jgi:mannose-6-phosphate isomerase-like protein (cupin superfamily)|nr:hypothetical protein [Rhodospirillales bacterium]